MHTEAPTTTTDALLDELRTADAALARAARLIANGRVEADARLPRELVLRLQGRRTRWDANDLASVADLVTTMPRTFRSLERGLISFSQARAIARAVRGVRTSELGRIDAHVGARALELRTAEPEQIVTEVEDLVAELNNARAARREQRAADQEFLQLQPFLDGGGSLYGIAGPTSFATIAKALDDAAELPRENTNAPGEPTTRARQRMDALVGICAGNAGQPGRARVLLSMELGPEELASRALQGAARILGNTRGRTVRLSPVGTQAVLCDSELVPIVTLEGRPIAVGDTVRDVPDKIRQSVIARDGGCRFPGCSSPASWSQIHHINGRRGVTAHHPDNLVLLCKRCHDRVHHQRWTISPLPDRMIAFERGSHRFTSAPRAAPVRQRE